MSVKAMRWAYGLFEIIDIPPAERAVLLALCWDHTDQGGCYPSQDRISLLSGYRERKIRDLLKALECRGLISRHVTRQNGQYQRTSYTLFGTHQRHTGADGKRASHRHKKAGGGHRQTGAGYRDYNTGDVSIAKIVAFPSQEFSSSYAAFADPGESPQAKADIGKSVAVFPGKVARDV